MCLRASSCRRTLRASACGSSSMIRAFVPTLQLQPSAYGPPSLPHHMKRREHQYRHPPLIYLLRLLLEWTGSSLQCDRTLFVMATHMWRPSAGAPRLRGPAQSCGGCTHAVISALRRSGDWQLRPCDRRRVPHLTLIFSLPSNQTVPFLHPPPPT